jgi:pimeloyl-ACP methyl ester carboxylesterase/DNA-binding CsgD family transcriptional regulator
MGQRIRFCTSADSTRIAYAIDGSGPPLVRTAFYLSHLELDWQCPPWKRYLEEYTRHHTLVRHDLRGFGLSEREVAEHSVEVWVRDLEAVVDAAGLERFAMIGMCHGGAMAIEYAARHPERVSRLVLYGAYARGRAKRGPMDVEMSEMGLRMVALGWGSYNNAFRQVWATMFQPTSTPESQRALAELQYQSSAGANAVQLLRAAAQLDVRASAQKVQCPTRVLHKTRNSALPVEEGRLLASLIPGARLVPLDSDNHLLTDLEPAWHEFWRELRDFLPSAGAARAHAGALHGLTPRELDILERIARGLDNAQIAAQLEVSEKTVRNTITRIFDKLAVENRPQAIVRAREADLGVRQAGA